MFLTEMYSRVWIGKNLSDMFLVRNGLKKGDAALPLLFTIALEYSGTSIYRFSRGWRNKTMNAGK